jgi:hypothetical protein
MCVQTHTDLVVQGYQSVRILIVGSSVEDNGYSIFRGRVSYQLDLLLDLTHRYSSPLRM